MPEVRYLLLFCCPFGQQWAQAAASAGGVDGVATTGLGVQHQPSQTEALQG